jgi:glutamate racemase
VVLVSGSPAHAAAQLIDRERPRFAPVGVFDSGIGGLSVVRALRAYLPAEDIVYFADSANCPYGSRDEAFIIERSVAIAKHLINAGVKLLVTACNTACAVALECLRGMFDVEIVGLEPAVKPAASQSRSGRIAVFATPRTIASMRLARLIDNYAQSVHVELVPAPGWVELVEDGLADRATAYSVIEPLVKPVVERGADVLVLGCTHYPFLEPVIREAAGHTVDIVESGEAVARRVSGLLERSDLLAPGKNPEGRLRLMTSSQDSAFITAIASRLLGRPVHVTTVKV